MSPGVRLSVNVNKVATLRNARGGRRPEVARAARIALEAGAHGITVHPRPDGRHIRFDDVRELRRLLRDFGRGAELNVEGYPSPEWMALVEEVAPEQATLVPDPPEALTSNAGWPLRELDAAAGEELAGRLRRLRSLGIRSSLFVDPDPDAARAAARIGADRVELYTEPYAAAFHSPRRTAVLAGYRRAAEAAGGAGLGVNAGHDLDLDNLPALVRALPGLCEVSIGHALIADALEMGLATAVRSYLAALAA